MERDEVLVLCYHAVADLSADPVLQQYGVDPKNFEEQLDRLRSRGFNFISPDEFAASVDGSARLPTRPALLTFDDCYEELPEVAETILEPRGIKAIAFAVSGIASNTNEWDQAIGAARLRLLDGPGLGKLASHGIEIGCHSRTHRPLPSVAGCDLKPETIGAADDLEALGLPRPRFFAYPHGQHDARSRQAVRDAGFAAAFDVFCRRVTPISDRYALPRVEILARDRGWRFDFKTKWPQLERLLRVRSIVQRHSLRAARALARTITGRG